MNIQVPGFAAGDYARCAQAAREALLLRPGYVFAHAVLCAALGMSDLEAAAAGRSELLRVHPEFSIAGIRAMMPAGSAPVADRMAEGLRRAGL